MDSQDVLNSEIEALKAIYQDELEIIPTKSAWNVYVPPIVRIRLTSDTDSRRFCILQFRFSKNYPLCGPEIRVENCSGVSLSELEALKQELSQKCFILKGQEMIYELILATKDLLDIKVDRESIMFVQPEPSTVMIAMDFEEEYLGEVASQVENEPEHNLKEIKEKLQLKEKLIKAQKNKKNSATSAKQVSINKEVERVTLEEAIIFQQQNQEYVFKVVELVKDQTSEDSLEKSFLGRPLVGNQALVEELYVTVKIFEINNPAYLDSENLSKLLTIEKDLQRLKDVRHRNLVSLLGYKIEEFSSNIRIIIVLEDGRGKKQTISQLLRICGVFGQEKIRDYVKQLLYAITSLHAKNVIHKDICCDNIIVQTDAENLILVSNSSFKKKLKDLDSKIPFDINREKRVLKNTWRLPEAEQLGSDIYGRKHDIWNLGMVLAQMVYGIEVVYRFSTAEKFLSSRNFASVLLNFKNPKIRPLSTDLLNHPFFDETRQLHSFGTFEQIPRGIEQVGSIPFYHNELSGNMPSRYLNDFIEIEFIGKGGFGEVVKAKNKLDGRVYAVKKVPLVENDRKILREITTLSRLHHPNVVRYFTTWVEDDDGFSWSSEEDEFSEISSSDVSSSLDNNSNKKDTKKNKTSKNNSTSSDNSSSTSSSSSCDEEDASQKITKTLYIQMEYCEKHTLRDLIDHGISEEEGWKILRQLLQGLAHIHSQGMIHRDLKPANIFIDGKGIAKIGDFGLATSNQAIIDMAFSTNASVEYPEFSTLTTGIGTAIYVAPEIIAAANLGTKYTHKVDMYSLGIMFFEMCHGPFSTGMERVVTIRELRLPTIEIPSTFPKSMTGQTRIIKMLLDHSPAQRPSSLDILKSDCLPPLLEDEFINESLRALSDPNTEYYHKILSALFNRIDPHMDYLYDYNPDKKVLDVESALHYNIIRSHLVNVFKRHGAIELDTSVLIPKNEYSQDKKAYHLLDRNGVVLQLPYDLTLPFARLINRDTLTSIKRYTFGNVYREEAFSGHPKVVKEADFDIIHPTTEFKLEIEVIKVVEEALEPFASMLPGGYSICLNHSDLLNSVIQLCQETRTCAKLGQIILQLQRYSFEQVKLQFQQELDDSVWDILEGFSLRGDIRNVRKSVDSRFSECAVYPRISSAFVKLQETIDELGLIGTTHPLYVMPLLAYNHHYYSGTIFEFVQNNVNKDFLAAGGRYDQLIRKFNILTPGKSRLAAAGVNIAMQKLMNMSAKNSAKLGLSKQQTLPLDNFQKKCDVYVSSFGKNLLKERLEIVKELWAADISSDFAYEDSDMSIETLLEYCRRHNIAWIVLARHKPVNRKDQAMVKIRGVIKKVEDEVPRSELVGILQNELHDKAATEPLHKKLPGTNEPMVNVDLLSSVRKGKMRQKGVIASKAVENITLQTNSLPIVVSELPLYILKELRVTSKGLEIMDKDVFSKLGTSQREQIEALKGIISKEYPGGEAVWLYSLKDDKSLLLQLK